MNGSIIRFILGNVLKIEGLLLFLPAIVSGIYFEHEGIYYVSVAAVCLILGFLMTRKKPGVLLKRRLYHDFFELDFTELFRLSSVLFEQGDSFLYGRLI